MKDLLAIYALWFVMIFTSISNAWSLPSLIDQMDGHTPELYSPLTGVLDIRDFFGVASKNQDKILLKKMYYQYQKSEGLVQYCQRHSEALEYASGFEFQRAKQTIMANLQYQGLKRLIPAIAKSASLLEMPIEKFNHLTTNLLRSSCSQNITVMGHRLIGQEFAHAFQAFQENRPMPSINNNLFPETYQNLTATVSAEEKKLEIALRNFRHLCSWGGDADNPRMLGIYLSNPWIMSELFVHMQGNVFYFDETIGVMTEKHHKKNTVVKCEGRICRPTDFEDYASNFPKVLGSASIGKDLEDIYCHYFYGRPIKAQREEDKSLRIAAWLKENSQEEIWLSLQGYIALLTGVPDLLLALDDYKDLARVLNDGMIDRFDKWAQQKIKESSRFMFYEEGLNYAFIRHENKTDFIEINLRATSGEVDRMLNHLDKFSLNFNLVFPKKYLAWFVRRYHILSSYEAKDELDLLTNELKTRVRAMFLQERKKLLIELWNDDLADMAAQEIILSLSEYKGHKLNGLNHEELQIPVNIEFGSFALSYARRKFLESANTPLTKAKETSTL